MKKIPCYHIDAFANALFRGNPAAVCPLTAWLPDTLMQQIAMENNLSETAFFVPEKNGFALRWFTPEMEINLCGHATLATAYALFHCLHYDSNTIEFYTKSGTLKVYQQENQLTLDFPSWQPKALENYSQLLTAAINTPVLGVYQYRDYIIELENEAAVVQFKPPFTDWNELPNTIGIMVTAPGNDVDFVCRFFVPNSVIGEDPVTGSAYSQLIPLWAKKLNKSTLHSFQRSKRGGELLCEWKGERVLISSTCQLFSEGSILLPE